MGAREPAAVLVELTDAAGSCMRVTDAGIAAQFLKNYTDAIGRTPSVASSVQPAVPRIGQIWAGQGGVYAGLCRGIDGGGDYHLFVHSDEQASIKWQAAIDWAKTLRADGHTDFALPTRKEQAVLFGNVPELFKREWYWSGEQRAELPSYAWMQHFSGGYQFWTPQDDDCRARAVRRLIIQ